MDSVNQAAEAFSADLHRYQKELADMKNVIQARICLAVPANVESVQAIEKQENVSFKKKCFFLTSTQIIFAVAFF